LCITGAPPSLYDDPGADKPNRRAHASILD